MEAPKIHCISDCTHNNFKAQQGANSHKKPSVSEFRALTDAAILRRSPVKTWVAAWSLIRKYQARQAFIWRDVANLASELPEAGLDQLAAFRLQCDARMGMGGAL